MKRRLNGRKYCPYVDESEKCGKMRLRVLSRAVCRAVDLSKTPPARTATAALGVRERKW